MEIDIEFVPKEWVFKLVSKDSIILLQLCQAGFNSALYYANKQQITAIIVSSCNKLWLFYYSLTLSEIEENALLLTQMKFQKFGIEVHFNSEHGLRAVTTKVKSNKSINKKLRY